MKNNYYSFPHLLLGGSWDEDYVISNMDFTFTEAKWAPKCLNITINDDSIFEENELFYGQLSNTDNIPRLNLTPWQTSITITDNESKETSL